MLEVVVRRICFHAYGGPEVLGLEVAPDPDPGPGELLVRTEAIGVTLPCVRAVRGEGQRQPLPGLPGGEVAGRVVAVGPLVTGFAVGDRVTAPGGWYADLAPVPAVMASHIPEGAGSVEAVALVRSGHVAFAALDTAFLSAGESVLITGAASAVGHLALQLAKIQGAGRVVAAVGSLDKAPFLRELGADDVVSYDSGMLGGPVDVVLDAVGGDLLPRAVAALSPGGRLIFFGSGGGSVSAFDLLTGSKTITGMAVANFARTQRSRYDEHHRQLWRLHQSGQLRAVVHAQIPLADAATAHRIIEARTNQGKVVLRP
ncbi:zinc-binding alcohol dehydrogenase family protein [Plantactinospora siamensis]|uniref:Zinc-binding alcohol dehydrogenase family protein n=1 Tax=Plantactinospora siamensis TaxID=555372 RepID=A0ABV6NUR2_9ACTN